MRNRNMSVWLLGLLGATVAGLAIWLTRFEAPAIAVLATFGIAFLIGLSLPALRWMSWGSRSLLILFALRPLLDSTQLREASFKSDFSPQNAYAVVVVAILLVLWKRSGHSYAFDEAPNHFILILLALAFMAWWLGGLHIGANGFARTSWGLLVALFIGPVFQTERQIDIFIRSVFYSSIFLLLILAFNLNRGEYLGESWRLGGQYGVANALAAIALTLFVYGLYVVEGSRTATGKFVALSLMVLLGTVVVFTQSRTVGALTLVSLCIWLWVQGHRRLLYGLGIPLLALLIASGIAANWRLTSAYSLEERQFSADLVNLTGRAYLWGETLQNYANASFLHKILGQGWGTLYRNFVWTDLAEVSSVTESSFLWFLAGTGVLGLVAFCTYLFWMLSRTWSAWRVASSEFERRLALLAFLAAVVFAIEGCTTDLVLSPLASGYLYAVLSIFVSRRSRLEAAPSVNGSTSCFYKH